MIACSQDPVWSHIEVESLFKPDFIHELDDLKCQNILSQIISTLEDYFDLLASYLLIVSHKSEWFFLGVENNETLVVKVTDNDFGLDCESEKSG